MASFQDIKSRLEGLTFRELVAVSKYLKDPTLKQGLGFDYMKFNKAEMCVKALDFANGRTSHHVNSHGMKADNARDAVLSDIDAALTGEPPQHGGSHDDSHDENGQPIPWGESEGNGQGEGNESESQGEEGKKRGRPKGSKNKPKDNEQGEGGESESEAQAESPQSDDDPLRREIRKIANEQIDERIESGELGAGGEGNSSVYRVKIQRPNLPEISDDAKPRHKAFKEVLQATAAGLNVLLVGPAGCGKTHMAEQVANALSLPFKFTGAVSSEYKLLGFIDAQGRTVRTEYRDAYEHGSVFLWDEMDASAAGAMLAFNAGLANGHQDFPDAIVPRHENFRAIASANTYGNGADRVYVGRNQLDAASLDRFYVIPMDYDESLEKTLYGESDWLAYVQCARAAIRSLNMRHVVSMRAIDQGLRMLSTDIPRKDIERAVLWKHLTNDEVAKVKAAMGEK